MTELKMGEKKSCAVMDVLPTAACKVKSVCERDVLGGWKYTVVMGNMVHDSENFEVDIDHCTYASRSVVIVLASVCFG
jgi:hypothetical protein